MSRAPAQAPAATTPEVFKKSLREELISITLLRRLECSDKTAELFIVRAGNSHPRPRVL
jgi:hypothetical protein